MRTSIGTGTAPGRARSGAWRWPLLLLACTLLTGCATAEVSTQALDLLVEELTACLPPPPAGWEVKAMEVRSKTTNLGAGKLDAAARYTEVEGAGEMEINIRTSPWCCWLVCYSGDIQKLTVQGRKAGLDPKKDKAVLYVMLESNYVATFRVDSRADAAQTAVDLATVTDFDCIEKHLPRT